MNNACPSCGAVYNVAAKDIGRKIKCKKCSSPLMVTDAGLVYDAPPAAPVAAAAPADDFAVDDAPPEPRAKGKAARPPRAYDRGPGLLDGLGGIPTLLFGLGTFLVIVFAFMPIIGVAATHRAEALIEKLQQERDARIKRLLPKGKTITELTSEEQKRYADDAKKITDDYEKQLTEAAEDARSTKTSNKRSEWLERYGQLFGFLFLSFGCIGYLRSEQALTLRIVAAVVLCFALMLIFSQAMAGGCGAKSPI